MDAGSWIALLGVAVTFLGMAIAAAWRLGASIEHDMRSWAREMFADRASMARVEQRLSSVEESIASMRHDTQRTRELAEDIHRRLL